MVVEKAEADSTTCDDALDRNDPLHVDHRNTSQTSAVRHMKVWPSSPGVSTLPERKRSVTSDFDLKTSEPCNTNKSLDVRRRLVNNDHSRRSVKTETTWSDRQPLHSSLAIYSNTQHSTSNPPSKWRHQYNNGWIKNSRNIHTKQFNPLAAKSGMESQTFRAQSAWLVTGTEGDAQSLDGVYMNGGQGGMVKPAPFCLSTSVCPYVSRESAAADSRPERGRQYQLAVEILQNFGLWDIAKKVMFLMWKNRELNYQIIQLKKETEILMRSHPDSNQNKK